MDLSTLPKDYFNTSVQFTRHGYTKPYPAIEPTKPENSVEGKVVLITGASRGIGGKGVAPAFTQAGAKGIILVATNAEKLAGIEAEIRQINPAAKTLVHALDIADKASVDVLFSAIAETFEKVDILVHSAATMSAGGDIDKEAPEEWWRNFEVNVFGSFLVIQRFLKSSLSWATSTNPAVVINFVSSNGYQVYPFMSGYSISKLGLIQFTAHIAATWPDTVTCVAVNPGLTDTDLPHPAIRASGFHLNDPALPGGTALWLAADPVRSRFLSGRMISSMWDVDELVTRKEEIVQQNLLTIDLRGTFGLDQFKDTA